MRGITKQTKSKKEKDSWSQLEAAKIVWRTFGFLSGSGLHAGLLVAQVNNLVFIGWSTCTLHPTQTNEVLPHHYNLNRMFSPSYRIYSSNWLGMQVAFENIYNLFVISYSPTLIVLFSNLFFQSTSIGRLVSCCFDTFYYLQWYLFPHFEDGATIECTSQLSS